jgi:hypothetical protein
MKTNLMSELRENVGPFSDGYLRPFVSDGPPSNCQVALLGYNAATSIPQDVIPKQRLCELLINRVEFEQFYGELRVKNGKRAVSTTRKRLGLIREAFSGYRVIETNLNAWPTKDLNQLRRLSAEQFETGSATARWVGMLMKPDILIAYGNEFSNLESISNFCDFSVESEVEKIHQFVDYYSVAYCNGRKVEFACITKHLSARTTGTTDILFSSIGQIIRARFDSTPVDPVESSSPLAEQKEKVAAGSKNRTKEDAKETQWHAELLKYFDLFGSGKQTSRRSYRLRGSNSSSRLFKLERGTTFHRLALMTKNFEVDAAAFSAELGVEGFDVKHKARYIEVQVRSFTELMDCLRLFVAKFPTSTRSSTNSLYGQP